MSRDCVALLLERFPHLQSVSLILLRRHETFRDLCEEYEACSQVCDRLERTNTDDALRREYSALRLRLERELLSYIEESTRGHGH
ncbi:MAG TPA: hypothetical protein PKE27_13140 [Povalibacter sp.]|uniref:hypothetical protein n=1 Tax=Povalibacter sp. TaxID=1962978 RepID=UPI002D139EA5|nr:hypothetical protein [Povalibacter sp.]HMN45522.1 hypothetical protein [Povalibacter sp.]